MKNVPSGGREGGKEEEEEIVWVTNHLVLSLRGEGEKGW